MGDYRAERIVDGAGNLLARRSVQVFVSGFDEMVSHSDPAVVAGAADASFEAFVAGASGRLFTMALLLTGHQRAEAEDLLQDALERTYRRWRRVCRRDAPERYVRRVMANAAVDRWRLVRRRREDPLTEEIPNTSTADHASALADRDLLLRALSQLPPRQRAVLVLRYFADLSESATAATLGVSVGAVKSQTSRGLARLRAITAAPAGRFDEGNRAEVMSEGDSHG